MGVTILPKKFYDAKNEQNELLQQIATSLGVTAGNLQDAINIANQASLNAQNKITELNENWNLLTTAQQQDAEVVTARQSTVKNKTFASLDARLEAAEQDLSVHQADDVTLKEVHGLRYEEGTWTPTFAGSIVAGENTYSLQVGTYVVIGNLVTCFFRLRLSVKDTAMEGDILLSGLPFAVGVDTGDRGSGSIASYDYVTYPTDASSFNIYPIQNYAFIIFGGDGIARVNCHPENINNTTEIVGSVSYRKAV